MIAEACCSFVRCEVKSAFWIQVCVCCTQSVSQSVSQRKLRPSPPAHVRRECLEDASSTRACTVMPNFTMPFSSRMW